VARGEPTQVGRAVAHLGVEHIAAYSPQARGPSERLFQTLQDRVPKVLVLVGITTMAEANAWLRDTYIPAHNARFATQAEQEGSAFVAVPGLDLAEVLCVQEERVVGNDNCVSFLNRKIRIPESPLRPHFVKATAKVHHNTPTAASLFSMAAVASTASTARAFQLANLARRTARERPPARPASGSRRAQGCQGRLAPRHGDLAFGEA
jgi:hypothetical protein